MSAERLRWGILSTARIARQRFIPGVRQSETGEVAAIASRDAARAQAAAAELGIPRAHGSYEALLADPNIDAVYVGLPNGLHPEWAIKSAQAGKHVLCEKPHTRYVAEAEQMVDAARRAGVILMEAFMYRLHPQQTRVLELVRSGAIGDVVFVRASFCFSMPRERRRQDVRLRKDLQGGALMDVGCYSVNLARLIMGDEPLAVHGQQHVDPEFGVDSRFAAVLRFPGDRLALVDGSFDTPGPGGYEVGGTTGRIQVERAYTPGNDPTRITVIQGNQRQTEEIAGTDQYGLEADHFARSVRAGRLLPPAEDGLAQAHVIEALYRSAGTE